MILNVSHAGELHSTKAETVGHWLSSTPALIAAVLAITVIFAVFVILAASKIGAAEAQKARVDK